jgi:AraC-like DNA-binding protein
LSLIVQHYPPSKKLSKYIDTYWQIVNESHQPIREVIVPDGCMDIICKNSKLFIVGSMHKPKTVQIEANDFYFGIRFKASILPQIFWKEANTLIDQVVPLSEIDEILEQNLKGLVLHIDYLGVINEFFESYLLKCQFNEMVLKAIKVIDDNQGIISLSELEESIGIGIRQMERLFKKHVGYSPKQYAKVVRFFHIYHQIIKSDSNLSIEAVDAGYYDQAHFNKEFKKYTGSIPKERKKSHFYNKKR